MNNVPTYLAIAIALFARGAFADSVPPSEEKDVDTTMVITATKTEAQLIDLPQSLSVVTADQINLYQPLTVTEILERLPGVGINSSNPFYSQPVIRGLTGGRVVINIDGINKTSDSNKGMALSSLDIDPYLLKQVEVQKGASSVLYGSGGMGGVIALRTKNALDLLEEGQQTGGFVRTQYSDLYDGIQHHISAYGATENRKFDWLVSANYFEEDRSTPSNDSDFDSRKVTAKLGLNLEEKQRLQLLLTDIDKEYKSESVVNPDKAKDQHAQLRYDVNSGSHLNLQAALSYAETERNASMLFGGQQDSTQTRIQFDTQNSHYFETGTADHELTYGYNGYRIEQEGTLNGSADNYVTPDGTRSEHAIFIQNRVDISPVILVGALRYNHYKMDSDNGVSTTEKELLPSIGATLHANDWLSLHANYSHDFRAPSIDDLFTELYNPHFQIDIVANPDLKPESSRNREVGVTFHSRNLATTADWRVKASYFDQDITDMITLGLVGFNPNSGRLEYGSVNKASVDRRGFELEASLNFNNLSFSLGTDYIKETDNQTQSESREPRTLTMSAGYHFTKPNIYLSWHGDASESHQSASGNNKLPGYLVHDLRLSMKDAFSVRGLELGLGADNLFDTEHFTYYGANGAERNFRFNIAYKL